ncbi:hypothetical protein GCK32_000205 [Trichostrongylus colubriformis]|uniref:Uncharacterized protein n=1 Tax=Trichostrongylus colubriformis TaxID=6319 RepID=A0AAN8EW62_TRICO
MRQYVVLLLLWAISAASTQTVEEVSREELMSPDARFLKRNSLSNMMRLGKRDKGLIRAEQLCDDCSLGNLLRLGRR